MTSSLFGCTRLEVKFEAMVVFGELSCMMGNEAVILAGWSVQESESALVHELYGMS